jgi:hypothetical protein
MRSGAYRNWKHCFENASSDVGFKRCNQARSSRSQPGDNLHRLTDAGARRNELLLRVVGNLLLVLVAHDVTAQVEFETKI